MTAFGAVRGSQNTGPGLTFGTGGREKGERCATCGAQTVQTRRQCGPTGMRVAQRDEHVLFKVHPTALKKGYVLEAE